MITLRDFRHEDATRVLELNQAAVPEVGSIDSQRLHKLVDWAVRVRVAEQEGDVIGLLFLMQPGSGYDSPNYRWFDERYSNFAYIDRIALAKPARRQGLGARFYNETVEWATDNGVERLCAEVNVEPPNPSSMRFHAAAGFKVVAEVEPFGKADYRVAMLVREESIAS